MREVRLDSGTIRVGPERRDVKPRVELSVPWKCLSLTMDQAHGLIRALLDEMLDAARKEKEAPRG